MRKSILVDEDEHLKLKLISLCTKRTILTLIKEAIEYLEEKYKVQIDELKSR